MLKNNLLKKQKFIFLGGAIVLIALAGFIIFKMRVRPQEDEFYLPVNLSADQKQRLDERVAKDLEQLELFPKDYNNYMDLGNLEKELGNASQAIRYYQKAWEVIPTNSTPWLNIGNVYILLGKYQEAEEAFLKAKSVNPRYHFVYYNLVKLYKDYLPEKSEQIRTIYLEGLKNTNNDYQLLQPFTDYLIEVKNYSEAVQYLEVLLEKIPLEDKAQIKQRIEEVKSLMAPAAS